MKRVLAWLAALFLLTGCDAKPFARELEATMLVQVLGVDWAEGRVELTAACDPDAGGGTATPVISASGADFEDAKSALQAAGEEYVSLTHVTQIVLGEEADLSAVLEAALEESALGQSATVWIAEKRSARELMWEVNGGAKRLSSIELNSGVEAVTVLQSRMRLEERGWVEVPVLTATDAGLELAGTVIFSEEKRET